MSNDNATSRDDLMTQLLAKYPKMWMRRTEDFNGTKGGIWTSGEDGDFFVYNAWEIDPSEERYVLGVRRDIAAILQDCGWYAEFYDPGTVLVYPA